MKKNITKLLSAIVLIGMILISKDSFSQSDDTSAVYKNQVKMNVPALFLKNFSFSYERAVTKKIAVGLSIRFAPSATLPFQGQLESLINNKESYERIKDFETGNFSITPQVRFYLGKQAFKGFYLAPFASYSTFNASGPYQFSSSAGTLDMPLSGDIKTVTGGFFIGSQFNVTRRIGLDLYIGPNYGSLSGTISGNKALNTDEQNALRNGLADLNNIPMIKTKYTVDSTGATVDLDGNWPGLRAGLSVAFKF
ncbi:MAG: DUF3575 domain-containing protein [Pedobacter sp.]|nr:DUF3575 domain-containing protein [Pedobacter sp.]